MSTGRKKANIRFFNAATQSSWFEQEKKEMLLLPPPQKILEVFWQEKLIKYNKQSVGGFKNYLKGSAFNNDKEGQEKINKLFADAVNRKISCAFFSKALLALDPKHIHVMNEAENLIPLPTSNQIQDLPRPLDDNDIYNIRKYMQDKKISGSITLRADSGPLITPDFPENQSTPFAMHSVGKVFTGMLALVMIREGILTQSDLNNPIQLNDSVKAQLSPAVQEQLKHVTLHQVMTHKAGLGDYLCHYVRQLEEGKVIKIAKVEDFLPFIEKETYPINESKYSNAGTLLVGLAIQHAFEKRTGEACEYNQILNKYIIEKAELKSFSPWRPENGKYNPTAQVAKNIVGSPAGGYWTTTADLAKFGSWIYEACKKDPMLKKLIEKYGQEFYSDPTRQLISHSGGIPSSSAYFSVSLKTGAVIAIMSDQPNLAPILHERIQRNIIADKGLDVTDAEMVRSGFGSIGRFKIN